MDKCILIVGSFERGHEFYGPFDNRMDASAYADRNHPDDNVRVAELERPDGRNADAADWSGSDGRFVLIVGDGYNGHSIVGTFDSPDSAMDYEERYESDCDGYHVIWVELQPME
jgi:hypothetical protein